ncbi:transporter substrate-binding domain-containing protein [Collimonas pratensis]|uniref:Bacterial extracellular solute-binding s, 3 family protein n=1 Tax=Collimonas pratensis TaxID=279113 RepID=A0ABN4MA25_9BURK|nr:transporter substrate-binding domain-containing protein [Collimonas pratensis]AMP14395.1 bacterial extracellular solute-binding s, 3 family protein [Collimonas pratensis]
MKLKHLIVVVSLAFSASSQAADMKELRIGQDPTYEPFAYKTPDGKLVGFEIDIANALCAEMKRKCVFVDQSWEGIIPSLLAKKYDIIISSMTRTEERRKTVEFSDKIYNMPQTIVAKKGSGISSLPASLKDKKVGVLKSSVQETYAIKVLEPAGATVVGYANTQDSYLDIESGRIDAVVAGLMEVKSGLLSKPEGKSFTIVASDLVNPMFVEGTGAAMRKQDTKLLAQVNEAIKAIRANGTYKKIADKYFDFDVYGK